MHPVTDLPLPLRRRLRLLFTDVDDTLTTDGRLHAATYAALERLAAAGIAIVPVTGRNAGWTSAIATHWPVAGAIAENGGVWFVRDQDGRRTTHRYADAATITGHKARLTELAEQALAAVPAAAPAGNPAFHETDVALDHAENVGPLTDDEVATLVGVFEDAGARTAVSSIHVHAWLGDFDKLVGTQCFARDALGQDLDAFRGTSLFVGDSLNDAPLFAGIGASVGVANVARVADRLPVPPGYVTQSAGGAGFVELAELILAARR